MGRLVRKPVHTVVCGRISFDPGNQMVDALLGYNNRSGQQPRQHADPGIGCSRIRRTESREVGIGRKRYSIDLLESDRGVTSFGICVHDEVECHSAIAEALLHELTAGVPWLSGKCGKEMLEPSEQGILMVESSVAGV